MPSSRSAAESGGGGVTPVFSLRLMTEGDLEAVLEIEGVSYPTPWFRDSFLHELRENRHARNFVVTRGSLVVGYVCLWVIGGCVQINNIALLLVGLGFDQLSRTPASIPLVKRIIRSITYNQAADLGHRLFGCATAQEVERLLRHEMRGRFPEYISGNPSMTHSQAGSD